MNIAAWLYRTARTDGAAPAIYSGDELHVTYAQFAARAAALGSWLESLGIQAGDRVALCMKNRVEYLEILYGVWWIGAAVVPVNCKLHPRETAWIVEHSGASIVLTDDGALIAPADLPAGCREIAVDGADFAAAVRAPAPAVPPVLLADETPAWLFYTSGTTGRPKGVMLSHGNLVAMATCYTVDVDDVSADDAALYAAPMSHGAGLYNFIHIRRAARHIVPKSRGFDEAEILDLADKMRNLSFFAAPTMVKRLVDTARAAGHDGSGIKTIVYGGGPMYTADIEAALKVFGPKFVQIYGQGESPMTITALSRQLIAGSDLPRWRERLSSVGNAQSCVDVRVVDDEMNDQPLGTPGEIVARGPTVMLGYWRNPEATAATIVDGWLKTGDIGHLDADGFLTLTDRSKDMIISGGTNIYPREVEEVLLRHPAVSEAAVVGQPSPEWGEDVVAFVVAAPGQSVDAATLDAWCRGEMASFKKPKRYEFPADLPKNAYGKVLKTELRDRLR